MKRTYSALLVVCVSSVFHLSARAEALSVTIPGQAWTISMDAPPLKLFQGQKKGTDFQYQAVGESGFNLSIFVEVPKDLALKTHQDCFDHYWPLAKRNPMIDQTTVKISKSKEFVKVAYLVKPDGQEKVSRNVNYYIAFKDRWIDVHVSVFPSSDADDKLLEAFEQNLKYAELAAKKNP